MTGEPGPSQGAGSGRSSTSRAARDTTTGAVEVTRILRPAELADADVDRWRAFQAAHHELDRPFFALEWFRALEEAGHSVEIAVLAHGGRDSAFFPFHRHGRSVLPPGGRLSDFQGWIGPPDLPVDPEALLRVIGARLWRFDHLLACQESVARSAFARPVSPLADLTDGFEAFLAGHRARGAGWVSQIPRKARKLSREVGELRFELATRDPAVLERLRDWKRAQRERTRTIDPFDEPWVERAVAACLAAEGPEFAGMLSALYAGEELVAAHLGLRSRGTFHIWFPAYDVAREGYSPGLILFFEMFRAVSDTGIRRVDFGKGPERYKSSWMTGHETLAEGYVDLSAVGRLVNGAMYGSRQRLRGTPVASLARGSRRRLVALGRRLRAAS